MDLQSHTAPSRILIPWDGLTPINQVLSFARVLGGQGANLTVLCVVPECAAASAISNGEEGDQLASGSVRPPVEVLDLPAADADPATVIETVAAERAVDLILVATPCQTAEELDPSCLAARLALDSPIPVMVVHFACDNLAAFPPPITRLLVPLDGSTRAVQVLPFAVSLASRLNLPVRLVMVIDPARILPPAYAYDPDASAEMVAGLTNDAHWALSQAEQMLASQGIEVRSDLFHGPVISSLGAAVKPGDVMVMTTHGIGGAPRGRLGSVAARLLADVPGPLVIMRGSPPSEIVSGDGVGWYKPISRPTA
jgi:nucleotide-binding universal stress UspA family protein